MNIRNIIFDLDGTLIDSSDGVVEAVNYSLRQMGQPEQPPASIKSFIGYPLSQMYASFTQVSPEELSRHFQVKAAETVVASTMPLPGVETTMRSLRNSGLRLAVASTKIKKHIEGIVAKFGWQDLLSVCVGGDEVARVKPDPEILHEALSRLSADPDETLVVGDTINDILAARAVPITTVAVSSPYGGSDKLLAAGPDFFIGSISELTNVLAELKKEAS